MGDSTIIVLALDTKTGYMYVLIASIERRHPDVIITDTIESSKKLKIDFRRGYTKLGIETVQFQQFFKDKLAEESSKCGEYLPVEEIQNFSDKNMRISTLQPDIKNGYIKFNAKHKLLMQQLKEYPMSAHDDGPDGLEMAVRLAKKISKSNQGSYQSILKRGLRFKKGAY
jgi:predicted phage terminase large subunit-like protein